MGTEYERRELRLATARRGLHAGTSQHAAHLCSAILTSCLSRMLIPRACRSIREEVTVDIPLARGGAGPDAFSAVLRQNIESVNGAEGSDVTILWLLGWKH